MTTCPLPMDWLDLLEGRPSSAERAHLAECPSCRAVVSLLEATTAAEPRLNIAPGELSMTLQERETPLAPGQIRWIAPAHADVRIPVLVLDVDTDEPSDDEPDALDATVHVVPLWTDRENATSSDLLLSAEDTTTGVPWRVAFRRQSLLPPRAIGSEIGELTSSGQDEVSTALDGFIAPDRSGPDIESEFDSRLTADEWLTDALDLARHDLRAPSGASPSLSTSDPVDLTAVDAAGQVYLFDIKRFADTPHQSFALAAASGTPTSHIVRAFLRTPSGVEVDGAFRWMLPVDGSDRLVLHADVVHGLNRPVLLVLYARDNRRFETWAHLASGAEVTLADAGVSHRDVERLEMRVP
jgi:hypothetical protein